MIAVKRFASTITGLRGGQYENEAEHLMRLKHPNIVQLVGYCSETETKLVRHNGKFVRAEETERLLCLEYMQKGSLREHLSDESSGLDWSTRYKIIEGICYGLHYLHEEWQVTPIIHMDLKPANILLDGNMVPKLADFGLSRLFGEEQTRTCTRSCKGTPGYMAPEYIEKGVITKMFDIFSLGVIIIEIITGLRDYPTDENETASQQYIDTVLNNWSHRLRKAQGSPSKDIDYQQIKKCIQIGQLCVKLDRLERPTIIQIIKMLERSAEAYKKEREVPVDISRFVQGETSNYMQLRHEQTINRFLQYNSSKRALLPRPPTQLQKPNSRRIFFAPDASPPAIIPNILVDQGVALSDESYSGLPIDTDVVMSLMQSPSQLPRNTSAGDRFSNHSEQQCNGQTTMQPQQFFTGFQLSRTNSFDLNKSSVELIENFMSQIGKNESFPRRLSKWAIIRAALKLASTRRLSKLPRNSDRFSNHSEQQCNGQTTIRPQQFFTGFQLSRTNSFDLNKSSDELIENFMSQIGKNESFPRRLSKWAIIRAALKSASTRRLFKLPRNSDRFSNHSEQQCNVQTIQTTMQSQQFVTRFQPSKTNNFDLNSCDELTQNFISPISNSEPLSLCDWISNSEPFPRRLSKWVIIRAALKLASIQRHSQLPRNSDRFSNYSEQQCNVQTTMQSQQFVTGFQPSRTNNFDLNSCDELT